MKTDRHILIVGNGSNAGYLLGLLSNRSEHDGYRVTTLASESAATALRRSGLRIETKDSSFQSWPDVIIDPSEAPDADLIILATRAEHARTVLRGLEKTIACGAVVLTIMAGVPWWLPAANGALRDAAIEATDPGGELLSAISIDRIVAGIAEFACDRPTPNLVRHYGGRRLTIGSAGPASVRLSEVQQLLSSLQLECQVAPDIQSALWSSLIAAGSIDSISILTDATPTQIAGSKAGQSISTQAMKEIETIGLALDLGPFGSLEDRLTSYVESRSLEISWLHEVERALALELDITIAAIIEIGHQFGIQSPTLEILRDIALIRANAFCREDARRNRTDLDVNSGAATVLRKR